MCRRFCLLLFCPLFFAASLARAELEIVVDHNGNDAATAAFRFERVPVPSQSDAAASATFSVVSGRGDAYGGGPALLHDGRVPVGEDQPRANFFFAARTPGGRISIDLGRVVPVAEINTYSWHPRARGPQVYQLYGSDGTTAGFDPRSGSATDLSTSGWHRIADVDTRRKQDVTGGQYGVSVRRPGSEVGSYRYLLFDMQCTEKSDSFGNTFYSEIDVVERGGAEPKPIDAVAPVREIVVLGDGLYRVAIDTTETPDLTEWTRRVVIPMLKEWYPRMVAFLPSDGFRAPEAFTVVFDAGMKGVAATSGRRIRCSGAWMRGNVKGEAQGALFHEMVHVIQQYGTAPKREGFRRPPGWLVEGITDYLRFYVFEPETRGAEIDRRGFRRARYDGSYRVTANFLNWVCGQHGSDFVSRLNAAIREGRYNDSTWKVLTGYRADELGAAWKTDLAERLGVRDSGEGD